MKILHVVPYCYPAWSFGGPPRAVYEIAQEQQKAGHEVSVLTTTALDKNSELPKGTEVVNGLPLTRLANVSNTIMWRYHFCTPRGTRDFFSHNTFDVVHLHEVRTALNYASLQFAHTTSFVLSPWGTLPYNNSLVPVKRGLDLLFLPHFQKKIALSFAQTAQEEAVLQEFDIGAQTEIMPLGISPEAFKHLPQRSIAREHLNLNQEKFYFLFLGRFSPHKGLKLLLEAFGQAYAELTDAHLLLVGRDDGYLSELKSLIRALQLDESVTILPPLYDSERLYAYCVANAFVFTPTVYEETGTACLEALACGIPVLTNNHAQIPYMKVGDGVIHVEASTSAVARGLKKLAKQAPPVNQSKVLKEFSWSSIAQKMVRSYKTHA